MGNSTAQTNNSSPTKRTSSSQKFRSSCHNCSNSKIKYGQERPSCQRCVAAGVSCHYSISRRMGEPPSNGRKQGTTPHAKSPCSIISSYIGMNGFAPAIDTSVLESDCSAISDMFQPEQSPNPFDILNDIDFPWSDMTNFEILSSPFSCPTQEDSMSGIGMGMRHPTAVGSSFSSSTSTATNHTRLDDGEEHDHELVPCAKLAANVLNNLSEYSSFCNMRSESTVPIKVDEALTTARKATVAFHELLTPPCSCKPQNALLLSIIIQKIIACYTAVIKRASNVDPSLSSSSSSSSSLAISFDISMDAPISIGAYQIDAEDEHRFKKQLVYNNLRKVFKTIDAFTARFCDGGSISSVDKDFDILDATLRILLTVATQAGTPTTP